MWVNPNQIIELNWRFIDSVEAGSNFVIALGWKKVYLKDKWEKSSSPLKATQSTKERPTTGARKSRKDSSKPKSLKWKKSSKVWE